MSDAVWITGVVVAGITIMTVASLIVGYLNTRAERIANSADIEAGRKKAVEASKLRHPSNRAPGASVDPYAVARARGFEVPDGLGIVEERQPQRPERATPVIEPREGYVRPRPIRDNPQA